MPSNRFNDIISLIIVQDMISGLSFANYLRFCLGLHWQRFCPSFVLQSHDHDSRKFWNLEFHHHRRRNLHGIRRDYPLIKNRVYIVFKRLSNCYNNRHAQVKLLASLCINLNQEYLKQYFFVIFCILYNKLRFCINLAILM